MADRTWNSVDSRLYEERWTQAAKLIAGVLLARCPNQYGIFDMPWWFLETVFTGIYDFDQIQAAAKEWEDAEFVKFYNDRKLVWIKKKWKREQTNPSELNIKGALRFLRGQPKDLADDFCALYEIAIPLITPLQGDTKGIPSTDSDSDSDSEKRKSKSHSPAKSAGAKKAKSSEPKTAKGYWLKFYREEFKAVYGSDPVISREDVLNAYQQYERVVKIHDDTTIRKVTRYFLHLKDPVWAGHKPHLIFKHFTRFLDEMAVSKVQPVDLEKKARIEKFLSVPRGEASHDD
jgi:hypothetical protein